MTAVQPEDARASFLFVGDPYGHHQESLGSTTPNRHMVLQPLTSQLCLHGCEQLVIGPIHARGGTLDLLMTDFPDVVRVAVVTLIDKSNHFSFGGHFDGTLCPKLAC